jgi:hypothetical protein
MDELLKEDLLWWINDILDTVDLPPPDVSEANDLIKRLMEVKPDVQ